jgi:hypothetical protein
MTLGGVVLRPLWIRMMARPNLFRLLLVGLIALINSACEDVVPLAHWCRPGSGHWKTYGEQKQQLMGAIMQPIAEKSRHCRNEHKRASQSDYTAGFF